MAVENSIIFGRDKNQKYSKMLFEEFRSDSHDLCAPGMSTCSRIYQNLIKISAEKYRQNTSAWSRVIEGARPDSFRHKGNSLI